MDPAHDASICYPSLRRRALLTVSTGTMRSLFILGYRLGLGSKLARMLLIRELGIVPPLATLARHRLAIQQALGLLILTTRLPTNGERSGDD